VAAPDDPTNVLFSSGTTGEPKVIAWSHLTPIKAAMDGHLHHDIIPADVVAWPTNLGWMMGPWLIYASLINGATIALHDDAPLGAEFGGFVADAGVTMLGVVPSLVAAWRASGDMDEFDWSAVTRFSSTGEASNPDDMRWLMGLPGNVPVIEYCGGTEVGGGYVAGTMVQPAVPATFTTPAFGIDVRLLDDEGRPADEGEAFLVPPSIGLSVELLNRNHHEVYYEGLPASDETDFSLHTQHHTS
jgi:acetyl-CoA synthetase